MESKTWSRQPLFNIQNWNLHKNTKSVPDCNQNVLIIYKLKHKIYWGPLPPKKKPKRRKKKSTFTVYTFPHILLAGCLVSAGFFSRGIKLCIPLRIHSDMRVAVLGTVSLKKAEKGLLLGKIRSCPSLLLYMEKLF